MNKIANNKFCRTGTGALVSSALGCFAHSRGRKLKGTFAGHQISGLGRDAYDFAHRISIKQRK